MGRVLKAKNGLKYGMHTVYLEGCEDSDSLELEADDGLDLIEKIQVAQAQGKDAFLETDVDFDG